MEYSHDPTPDLILREIERKVGPVLIDAIEDQTRHEKVGNYLSYRKLISTDFLPKSQRVAARFEEHSQKNDKIIVYTTEEYGYVNGKWCYQGNCSHWEGSYQVS